MTLLFSCWLSPRKKKTLLNDQIYYIPFSFFQLNCPFFSFNHPHHILQAIWSFLSFAFHPGFGCLFRIGYILVRALPLKKEKGTKRKACCKATYSSIICNKKDERKFHKPTQETVSTEPTK